MAQKERKKAKKKYIFGSHTNPSQIFSLSLCRPRGMKVDYLEKYFGFDIRDLDRRLWAPGPEAFAAYLDENSDSWCEKIQLLSANPSKTSP